MTEVLSQSIDPYINNVVYGLVANLIGDEPRTHEMGENRVMPEDIKQLAFPARVLELIYFLEASGQPPSEDAIRASLSAAGQEDYVQRMGDLMSERSEFPDVAHPAFIIKKIHVAQRKNMDAYRKIGELFASAEGMPADHTLEAAELLQDILGDGVAGEPLVDQIDMGGDWLATVRQLVESANQGVVIGPSWPWITLRRLVPRMRRGDMHSLAGMTGFGKTLFGGVLAEYWAWTQGYDVYVYLFETTRHQYFSRQVARNCRIPVSWTDNGLWDPDQESPATEAFREFARDKLENSRGFIHYQECAGWNHTQLDAAFVANEQRSRENGREAVHLIDYYQKIDTTYWKFKTVPHNELAAWLKTTAQRRKLYLFVLLQEKEDGSKMPKEGDEIKKQSQVYMRLDRKLATSDLALAVDGQQLTDNVGEPRWWHRSGGWSKDTWIEVIKANQDTTGNVGLLVEAPLFRVIMHRDQS